MTVSASTSQLEQHVRSKREQLLMIVERRSLTRWGIRIEREWANADGQPETHVRIVALKSVSAVRTWLIDQTGKIEQELLVRWLLSWLVDPADAVYAKDVINTCVISVPMLEDDEVDDDAIYA